MKEHMSATAFIEDLIILIKAMMRRGKPDEWEQEPNGDQNVPRG